MIKLTYIEKGISRSSFPSRYPSRSANIYEIICTHSFGAALSNNVIHLPDGTSGMIIVFGEGTSLGVVTATLEAKLEIQPFKKEKEKQFNRASTVLGLGKC